jgi:hypothetical protein
VVVTVRHAGDYATAVVVAPAAARDSVQTARLFGGVTH